MTHTTEQERTEFEKHILAPNGFFDKGDLRSKFGCIELLAVIRRLTNQGETT